MTTWVESPDKKAWLYTLRIDKRLLEEAALRGSLDVMREALVVSFRDDFAADAAYYLAEELVNVRRELAVHIAASNKHIDGRPDPVGGAQAKEATRDTTSSTQEEGDGRTDQAGSDIGAAGEGTRQVAKGSGSLPASGGEDDEGVVERSSVEEPTRLGGLSFCPICGSHNRNVRAALFKHFSGVYHCISAWHGQGDNDNGSER